MKRNTSDADYAITLRHVEADDLDTVESIYYWSGWKRRHWPADVIRRGLRLYGFDTKLRRFCVLLEITRGGSFVYRTRKEFSANVLELTGWKPNQGDSHWLKIPISQGGKECTGIALRWRVIRPVRIDWPHRFSRLGWERLTQSKGLPDIDPLETFAEGDRELRMHLIAERNATLWAKAKNYWEASLGTLHCLVCGFSFAECYGDHGTGFIEMHHDVPIAVGGKRFNRPKDLQPVCANCHRMIHRDPHHPLRIAELKNMMMSLDASDGKSARRSNARHSRGE